jgi:pimeloyl-ACP methyl ester carboxylesterase
MTTKPNYIAIQNAHIHYLKVGQPGRLPVLLLHGTSFSAQTWRDLGTLELLAQNNYQAIAIDLPGFGKSQPAAGEPHNFLSELLDALQLDPPVLISPSMSGRFSLPVVVSHPQKLRGFVAVAPIDIPRFKTQLKNNPLPALAIWGSDDHIIPVAHADLLCQLMPNAEKVILADAGHACYMRATPAFHHHVLRFLEQCYQK